MEYIKSVDSFKQSLKKWKLDSASCCFCTIFTKYRLLAEMKVKQYKDKQ